MKLVIDIETAGSEFETLSESQQEYLLRYAETEKDDLLREEKIDEAKRYLSLYPFTAKVIVIGMLNADTGKMMALYLSEEQEEIIEENQIKYKPLPENEMLQTFWKYAKKAEQIITFNGRNFDIPFLTMRSALLQIKPSRNFMKNRYDNSCHIDLLEEFTFHGLTKKFNLDFYCNAFGIESPKSKGITGMEVKELYRAGRIKDIALYCAHDVTATFRLYELWNKYLNIQKRD